jgi:hypothetical protein
VKKTFIVVIPRCAITFQATKTAALTKKPLKKIEKPVLASTWTRVNQ